MPNAFLINEALNSAARSRVDSRLGQLGFTLKNWPTGKIGAATGSGDVALLVIVSGTCSVEEQRRSQDAVNSGVPIIAIYLDEPLSAPDIVGDYSSSTLGIDAEDLGEALARAKTVNKSPSGVEEEKTHIKHNKCK